eukprot:scaffold17045_cov95-Skeletonema_marinoi.AAC.1
MGETHTPHNDLRVIVRLTDGPYRTIFNQGSVVLCVMERDTGLDSRAVRCPRSCLRWKLVNPVRLTHHSRYNV